MIRKETIESVMNVISNEYIVCNIGVPSRELYWIKDRNKNFYMLGSMGLASSIGLGLALSQPKEKFIVIDGDGSILMNLGSLTTIGRNNPSNLVLLIIDNSAYGSTGFQPTFTGKNVDLARIAKNCGISNAITIKKRTTLLTTLKKALASEELWVIVVKAEIGSQIKTVIPLDVKTIKNRFIRALN